MRILRSLHALGPLWPYRMAVEFLTLGPTSPDSLRGVAALVAVGAPSPEHSDAHTRPHDRRTHPHRTRPGHGLAAIGRHACRRRPRQGAGHRRKRGRQGPRRALHPCALAARRACLRRPQLRRHFRDAARVGAVRAFAAASPARTATRWDCSSWRIAARCSSTRSAR